MLPLTDISLFSTIIQIVLRYGVEDVLLMGDFNLTSSPDLNRLHSTSHWSPGLAQWASTFTLTDIWRHSHPTLREFTCHSSSFRMLSCIDLAYTTQATLRRVSQTTILPGCISNHSPLIVTLLLAPPGKRLWRLSRYWIADSAVQEAIQEGVCQYRQTNAEFTTSMVAQDAIKAYPGGVCLSNWCRMQCISTVLGEVER